VSRGRPVTQTPLDPVYAAFGRVRKFALNLIDMPSDNRSPGRGHAGSVAQRQGPIIR
jgi:hypothetical protein